MPAERAECARHHPDRGAGSHPRPQREHASPFRCHGSCRASGQGRVITLHGQPELRAADVAVPGDPSSAAFLVAAALVVPDSRLTIEGVGLNELRCGFYATLVEMGADVVVENRRVEGGEPVGDLVVAHGTLRAVDVPPERAPSMIDEFDPCGGGGACRGDHAHARPEGVAGEGERPSRRHCCIADRERGARSRSRATTLIVQGSPGGQYRVVGWWRHIWITELPWRRWCSVRRPGSR